MNPTDPKHPWQRLAAAARRVPDDRDTAAPYGFATRVAALATTAERSAVSMLERFSLRALGVASLLALISIAANYSEVLSVATSPGLAEEVVADADAVTLLVTD